MGLAFCLLFAWWFFSGIFMMYYDYPSVSQEDRLQRSRALDASTIRLSPEDAWAKLGRDRSPGGVRLAIFDGRPLYTFVAGGGGRGGRRAGRGGRGGNAPARIYADDGTPPGPVSRDMAQRIASEWVSPRAGPLQVEEVTKVDQWTLGAGLRNLRPVWKFSFPGGNQVYVSGASGDVVQYTTRGSRIGAYLGPIAHWLYFTPLRVQQKLWSNIVIWTSGVATIVALLGLIVGISMYSPSGRFQYRGAPSHVPYTGQKRLHMILGLFFGILACTWSFSGMLSMDPPFLTGAPAGPGGGRGGGPSLGARIQAALRPRGFDLAAYASKPPQAALAQLAGANVKELEFTSFDGKPIYRAYLGNGESKILPVDGSPESEFDRNRVLKMVTDAAQPSTPTESRMLTRYDAYYLDRNHGLPLPVLLVRFNDPDHSSFYIDQRTARIVGLHSDRSSFMTRWLYHGLHSLNFPWLYNYRPAWDIVVLTLMLGGLALSVTSIIMGYQLLSRKIKPAR